MPKTKQVRRRYVTAPEMTIDHDTWNHRPPKLPRASQISLGDIHGVLPFNGVRNPSSRSATSHRVFLPYRTAANDWVPRVGIAESSVEAAVGLQAAMAQDTHDVEFQPLTVTYLCEDQQMRSHTYDLRITFRNGSRRLVFVRYGDSLKRATTARDIDAIIAGTPAREADEVMIVNASDYTRQRRENILRMHLFMRNPDPAADDLVQDAANSGCAFYYMKDLFPHVALSAPRAFAACYRLVARGVFRANLDNVLWEHSRLELAS